jgi:hypothetical protein
MKKTIIISALVMASMAGFSQAKPAKEPAKPIVPDSIKVSVKELKSLIADYYQTLDGSGLPHNQVKEKMAILSKFYEHLFPQPVPVEKK